MVRDDACYLFWPSCVTWQHVTPSVSLVNAIMSVWGGSAVLHVNSGHQKGEVYNRNLLWWMGWMSKLYLRDFHLMSWFWSSPAVCMHFLLCVVDARLSGMSAVFNSWLLYRFLVCPQNSFISRKIHFQCVVGSELLT